MARIDYRKLKMLVSMNDVVNVLQWKPVCALGGQERGKCPVHRSTNQRSRSFSVDRRGNRFQCFTCKAKGNQLDLFVQATGLKLYDAAVELCRRLRMDVPYLETPE